MLPGFAYVRPTTLKDAFQYLGRDKARLHAGGTDLLGCLRDGVFEAGTLVSLSRVDGLRGISATPDGGLRIGALTTIAEVAAHATIRERYAGLAQAAASVASPQLRNQGTLGGNLCQKARCWYYRGDFHCIRKGGDTCYAYEGENQGHCLFGGNMCFYVHPSDTAPALVALGAVVQVASLAGSRLVPLKDFFVPPSVNPTRETALLPGEILTSVTLPATPAGLRSSYRKVRARQTWDFALACVALALQTKDGVVQHARVVLSGAAAIPWSAVEAEKALVGQRLDGAAIQRAAEAAVAGAQPLAQNGYKVALFRGLVQEQLEAIAKES
jgi:xanthine dehydrogenase YagS FAD-binding subunit